MTDPDAEVRTQLRHIEEDTGRSVAAWAGVLRPAGPLRHGQLVSLLKSEHGLTHGNANALARAVLGLGQEPVSADELLAQQYSGPKAALLPVYEELVTVARALGDDVEVAVKRTGVSLRRRTQFALVEVPSRQRARLGLNLRGTGAPAATDRLRAPSGMCTHSVDLADADDVDDEVVGWLRAAYLAAG